MKSHKVSKVDVHLVSTQAPSGLADATRKVETVGMTVVRVTTDHGTEAVAEATDDGSDEALEAEHDADIVGGHGDRGEQDAAQGAEGSAAQQAAAGARPLAELGWRHAQQA